MPGDAINLKINEGPSDFDKFLTSPVKGLRLSLGYDYLTRGAGSDPYEDFYYHHGISLGAQYDFMHTKNFGFVPGLTLGVQFNNSYSMFRVALPLLGRASYGDIRKFRLSGLTGPVVNFQTNQTGYDISTCWLSWRLGIQAEVKRFSIGVSYDFGLTKYCTSHEYWWAEHGEYMVRETWKTGQIQATIGCYF